LAIVKKIVNAVRTASDALTSSSSSVPWPTEDDLTREAVAEALDLKLRRDGCWCALHARAASWRISMRPTISSRPTCSKEPSFCKIQRLRSWQWLDTAFEGHRKLTMLVLVSVGVQAALRRRVVPRLKEILPPRHMAMRTLRAA